MPFAQGQVPQGRLRSIDALRGIIMVLMALDHARWFFTDIVGYQPETLARTNIWLFLTRFVTHYCAPGFFLLAGVGIFLYGAKRNDRRAVQRYLWVRGAILIALELMIVGSSWVFDPGYSFAGVIWGLGWSFVFMAALVALPVRGLLVGSLTILVLHNLLLDSFTAPAGGWALFAWRFLYAPGGGPLPGITDRYFFLYPIVPWLAIMVFGYALGGLFHRTEAERKRLLLRLGWGCIAAFVVLRLTNVYGNPEALWISRSTSGDFSLQGDVAKTVINFLNTEKYPPSLQFVLMTLGPMFLWLGATRLDGTGGSKPGVFSRAMILFGRVPLFFYVLHLPLIHLMALGLAALAGQPVDWITFGADPSAGRTPGFGFGLVVVWVMWLVATAILFAACRWYADYKRQHGHIWLKYL